MDENVSEVYNLLFFEAYKPVVRDRREINCSTAWSLSLIFSFVVYELLSSDSPSYVIEPVICVRNEIS